MRSFWHTATRSGLAAGLGGGMGGRGVEEGAPIDGFGVGTRMDVSADAPYLDMAYKLVQYAGRHALKTSPGKETWTGEKQVYRLGGAGGGVAAGPPDPPAEAPP